MTAERIETTYADLRPVDLVIDKAGNAWPIDELTFERSLDGSIHAVNFWLCDPVTKVKMHMMAKNEGDPVTVSRVPTHADEAAKLILDFDFRNAIPPEPLPPLATMAEAVADVEEIGGTVEAEVTAEEVDAAAAATYDAPVSLPPFADMTPLEQRSHLYLLHGLYGSDVTGRAELIHLHESAHTNHDAGTLKNRHVPHVHTTEVK